MTTSREALQPVDALGTATTHIHVLTRSLLRAYEDLAKAREGELALGGLVAALTKLLGANDDKNHDLVALVRGALAERDLLLSEIARLVHDDVKVSPVALRQVLKRSEALRRTVTSTSAEKKGGAPCA